MEYGGLLAHSRKWNFAWAAPPWSMPMPPSSPHSSVTKWRSASQESKSIVNYVMLFLWAIIYGFYLSRQRCWRLAPRYCSKLHRRRVHFTAKRLKNTSEVGAAGMSLWWIKHRKPLNNTRRASSESWLFIQAEVLNNIQGLQLISLLHWHSGWKHQLNALNVCKFMQHRVFSFSISVFVSNPIH